MTAKPGSGERSVGIGGDNTGIAATGDHATNVQLRTVYQAAGDQTIVELPPEALCPVDQVAAPPRLVNLPLRSHLFVGREDELAELHTALSGSGTGGVVVAAVHGLGGVGKSTLAARYAVTHADEFTPVWWITADTAAAVQAGLAGLAVGLQPELTRSLPLEALAQRAIGWLATHGGWLLVLDNVTDPADVEALMDRTLAGRVLVTSRLGEGWYRLNAQVIRLDILTEKQAIDLLTRIAGQRRPDGAAELVAELGCLPLAVEQAAAYLHQNRLSPRDYLGLLANHPAVMYDQAARGSAAERTVARIWRLTLDDLTDVPLAGDLLRVLAWYGPEPIPRTLLDGLAEAPRVHEAVGALAAFNMITVDGGTVTVHPLVQAVARTADPVDPHRQDAAIDHARERATGLLNGALPSGYRDPGGWPDWRALAPHIDALARNAAPGTDTDDTARLLTETALFLHDQGAIDRAIAYHRRALAACERPPDADPRPALIIRNNLAHAYLEAGDRERAIPLFEGVVAGWEQVVGADHPDTLTCRNNLAYAYVLAGDPDRAVPLLEQTLADCERVLGTDHPDTLRSRNNLARCYETAGDLDRAIPLFERTLADSARVLGADHPDVLTTRNNLACGYETAGDLDRAIPLLEQTLADRERVLGTDHPDTLTSRNNLAYGYVTAGDPERAIPLYERTLTACERVLGVEHPITQTARTNLEVARTLSGVDAPRE